MRLEAVAQIFNSLTDKIAVSGIGITTQALKIEIKVVGIHVDVNQRTIQIGQHDDRLDGGLAVFAEVARMVEISPAVNTAEPRRKRHCPPAHCNIHVDGVINFFMIANHFLQTRRKFFTLIRERQECCERHCPVSRNPALISRAG